MKKYYEDNKESILASAQLKMQKTHNIRRIFPSRATVLILRLNGLHLNEHRKLHTSKIAYEQDPEPKKLAAKQASKVAFLIPRN